MMEILKIKEMDKGRGREARKETLNRKIICQYLNNTAYKYESERYLKKGKKNILWGRERKKRKRRGVSN